MFKVVKHHRRLWIACGGNPVYTYPNFLRPPQRRELQALADKANARGMLDIEDVMWFERNAPRTV